MRQRGHAVATAGKMSLGSGFLRQQRWWCLCLHRCHVLMVPLVVATLTHWLLLSSSTSFGTQQLHAMSVGPPLSPIRNHHHYPSSLGERIQLAQSTNELLAIAADIWLPHHPYSSIAQDDDDSGGATVMLPPHLLSQRVHHERRMRWSAQLLHKLGEVVGGEGSFAAALAGFDNNNNRQHRSVGLRPSALEEDGSNEHRGREQLPLTLDSRLARAALGVSIPFVGGGDGGGGIGDRPNKEGRYLKDALCGIHNLLGQQQQQQQQQQRNHNHRRRRGNPGDRASPPPAIPSTRALRKALVQMMVRVEALAIDLSIVDCIETRWACRGISARMDLCRSNDDKDEMDAILQLPNLSAKVAHLPFDILPAVINWNNDVLFGQIGDDDPVTQLRNEIPFQFDTIVTRTGATVTERRGTAWMAEPGIGALAYSGKLMAPHPMTKPIRSILRTVEVAAMCTDGTDSTSFSHPDIGGDGDGGFFDCALCNYYPTGASACKFHSDPEHGTHWDRLTCVVAAGAPRRFAFRPIPGVSQWRSSADKHQRDVDDDPTVSAVITLFAGDVVKMVGRCNDEFHHAVYPGSGGGSNEGDERVSLVLKRALIRSGGQRGHSLAGQGRRRQRKSSSSHPDRPRRTVASASSETTTRRKKRVAARLCMGVRHRIDAEHKAITTL
jgi:hypothetical protein